MSEHDFYAGSDVDPTTVVILLALLAIWLCVGLVGLAYFVVLPRLRRRVGEAVISQDAAKPRWMLYPEHAPGCGCEECDP